MMEGRGIFSKLAMTSQGGEMLVEDNGDVTGLTLPVRVK